MLFLQGISINQIGKRSGRHSRSYLSTCQLQTYADNWNAGKKSRLGKSLNFETFGSRSMWHKHVNFAVPKCNKSYHISIGCEPGRVSHGLFPHNVHGYKIGVCPQKQSKLSSKIYKYSYELDQMVFQDFGKKRGARLHQKCTTTKKQTLLICGSAELSTCYNG